MQYTVKHLAKPTTRLTQRPLLLFLTFSICSIKVPSRLSDECFNGRLSSIKYVLLDKYESSVATLRSLLAVLFC